MNPVTYAAATVHGAAVQAGIFDSANSLISEATTTVKGIVALAAICVVLVAMWASKSWKTTATVVALAVFVVWLISFNGISSLASQVNGELQGAALVPSASHVLNG
ncbi:MAG: hypothetical protein Q4D96_10085 [Propionibacteriaceae bacterium]|nr:hypothetical protein [Propionibacteriaceae bacterium]